MKAVDPATPPKRSKKKLLVIIGMALLVVGLGAGAAWYFTMDKTEAEHKAAKAEPPEYVPIDAFTVNLQPENGDQYLQIQFTLQVPNQKEGELIKANMAKVRSRLLMLLSSKKASEITTPAGKHQLAQEIVATLKQPFADKGPPQQISDVLYTAFIIQ